MKPIYLLLFLIPFFYKTASAQMAEPAVTNGVSLQLAGHRSRILKNIQYQLRFSVPARKEDPIKANEILTFELSDASQSLQLDFKPGRALLKSAAVNGRPIPIRYENEHLILPAQQLKKGQNSVSVSFIAGNAPLNRNDAYLYALFVPDRARQTFPCFDQPDLKARFELSLTVPAGWSALANGKLISREEKGTQQHFKFANSDLLPTYLFSFTAGRYTMVTQAHPKLSFEFLHRETDQSKVQFSVDSIFQLHRDALRFLEDYTGIPYPFQKFGFVAVPDFQFNGMEHPGEVQYKASSLFLDQTATKDQYVSRANLVSHETGHMWFGDLVTMKWFNDVWMKEVFANFMADKVTEIMMGTETFNLKFLQDHYPAAYSIDRTAGANPIRQELDNLQDAGSLYGNIIYHKAPIMMRQLERLMGPAAFRNGVRDYLKTYAHSNATWPDLIAILANHTPANLKEWSKVWVERPGRPVFSCQTTYAGNKIERFIISQRAENGSTDLWPQSFGISLFYADGRKDLVVHANAAAQEITAARGLEKPLFVLFNSDGQGYGLFPVDPGMGAKMFLLQDPLQRAAAYLNSYEAMLAGGAMKPTQLLDLLSAGVEQEKNEMNLRMLTNYMTAIYWSMLSADERLARVERLEAVLWEDMLKENMPNLKKLLFKTYQDIALSKQALAQLHAIWQEQRPPAGLRLSEDDYTNLAFTLALKTDRAAAILAAQRERVDNAERKARITFLMPALSPDRAIRADFFKSLADRKNRGKEGWVTAGLSYLNHPLRQGSDVAHLKQSLDLLEEIEDTGDIFFPQSWLSAVFATHRSPAAYEVVTRFLESHPGYNPRLKAKILQATDNLRRAQRVRGQ